MEPEVVELGQGDFGRTTCCVHDEKSPEPSLAYLLSRMRYPEFPEPIGVFRAVDRPRYDVELNNQIEAARAKKGRGSLEKLFHAGDTWTVDDFWRSAVLLHGRLEHDLGDVGARMQTGDGHHEFAKVVRLDHDGLPFVAHRRRAVFPGWACSLRPDRCW